jgi:hypothetical protein
MSKDLTKFIKIPILVNKKNGQINSYFKQKELPKKVLDAIRKQPGSVKNLFVDIEGWD